MTKAGIAKLFGHYSLQFLCRAVLGGLFIYASLDKIVQPQEFARVIYDYRLVPDFAVYWVALLLPWFELICGLLLISGLMVRSTSALLGLLLIAFMAALSFNALRGLDINCGCFTLSGESGGSMAGYVFRDFLILIPAVILFFFHPGKTKN